MTLARHRPGAITVDPTPTTRLVAPGPAGQRQSVRSSVDSTIAPVLPAAEALLLGVGEGTLGNWVRPERIDRGERAGLTTSETAELAELRKENARLLLERDLLKRATAFWVKES
jgi:hypothetical protein